MLHRIRILNRFRPFVLRRNLSVPKIRFVSFGNLSISWADGRQHGIKLRTSDQVTMRVVPISSDLFPERRKAKFSLLTNGYSATFHFLLSAILPFCFSLRCGSHAHRVGICMVYIYVRVCVCVCRNCRVGNQSTHM